MVHQHILTGSSGATAPVGGLREDEGSARFLGSEIMRDLGESIDL
jgi:hypothetical protein